MIKQDGGGNMTGRKLFTLLFIGTILAGCATPKIQVNSADMAMEVKSKVPIVHVVNYSPDGNYVISGGWDNSLYLWDVKAGKKAGEFKGHTGIVVDVCYSPDGRSIASASYDNTIRIWDIASKKEKKRISGLGGTPQNLACSPDGKYIVGFIHPQLSTTLISKFYDVQTGSLVREFTGFIDGGVPPAAKVGRFSPDGGTILMKENQRNIVLKEVASGGEIWRASPGEARVLSFTRDGKHVLAVARTGGIERFLLLDAATGREVRELDRTGSLHGFSNSLYDQVRAIAVSPDGRSVISGDLGGRYRLWDLSTGAAVKQLQTVDEISGTAFNVIPSVSFSPDGRTAVVASIASVRLHNTATGRELATLIKFEDGEWLVITPEGYYNASEKGAQYLTVTFEGKNYTVDQFYDVFYRPDIVAAVLSGQDVSGLTSITMKDARKSPPPLIEFTSQSPGDGRRKARVCYRVQSAGGGIGEVRLFHNGKLIQSDGYYREMARFDADANRPASLNGKEIYADMRSISVKQKSGIVPVSAKPKGDLVEDCRDIDAVPGENEVSLAAFNAANTVQSYMKTVKFNSNARSEDPHLYILSIGINHYRDKDADLKYAVKDAIDIEQKLLTQSASLYRPHNIHYELLTDSQAVKGNILRRINELSKIINPGDSFILFAAGHGALIQNQYYMLTHDYDGQRNEQNMISSNEIAEISKKIKSLSQLFIFDTCHAGGVDTIVRGLYDARMSVLAKKMGLHIYASASDKQSAMDGYKGNGLFTYTLLEGLNNNKEADLNKDGKVTIVGLGEYAKKRTVNISKEVGDTEQSMR